jgi:hypothetical protein
MEFHFTRGSQGGGQLGLRPFSNLGLRTNKKFGIRERNVRKNLIPAVRGWPWVGALQLDLVSLPALQEDWHFWQRS